jgi:BCD family chlorophyll transporter-like MFS transporter
MGSLMLFGGLAIMPFAILVLSGAQEAFDERLWLGIPAAAIAFLMVGAGVHITQTVGLALATDLTTTAASPPVLRAKTPSVALTRREQQVLDLIAAGEPNRAIASALGISENTVKNHVRALLEKLHARSRTDAVVRGVGLGLTQLPG